MANCTSNKFNNKIQTLSELEEYLNERMDFIRNNRGKETTQERELQDVMDMIKA